MGRTIVIIGGEKFAVKNEWTENDIDYIEVSNSKPIAKCDCCGMVFDHILSLQQTENNKLVCQYCKENDDRVETCYTCNKVFLDGKSLKDGMCSECYEEAEKEFEEEERTRASSCASLGLSYSRNSVFR